MFPGHSQTIEEEPLYEAQESSPAGRANSASYRMWIFLSQVLTLFWKESIDRVRRPRRAFVELFLPALVVLVLLYAVNLSPIANVNSFRHESMPKVSLNADIPDEAQKLESWNKSVSEVMKWRDVFAELNLTSFFFEYVQSLAKLRNVMRIYKENDASWTSMWTPEEVTSTLLTNRPAASPFKVPTFDEYTDIISSLQVSIGKAGLKRTMYDDPLIRFILKFGRLAFALGDTAGTERDELIVATEKIIEYLNATTQSFADTVICRSGIVDGQRNDCAFNTVHEAVERASAYNFTEALWAVVRIDRLSLSDHDFRYAVLLNRKLMPRWASIETFPQGLGKEYATYAFTGVLTLQYELNTYFSALVKGQPNTAKKLPLTPLVNSICNAVQTPHNATRGLFTSSTDSEQEKIVKEGVNAAPMNILKEKPFTEMEAVYAPCRYEISVFCKEAKDDSDTLACLENATEEEFSATCSGAIEFIQYCLPKTVCKDEDISTLLLHAPSKLPTCVDSMPLTCASNDYARAVAQSRSAAASAEELREVCRASYWKQDIFTSCTRHPPKASPISKVSQAVLESFQPCRDDYESICPTRRFGEENGIPYACLYENRRILSDSCQSTHLVSDILPNMFTRELIQDTVDAPTYYCREVHNIQKTLVNSIVAQAFPADSYDQHFFFISGGPFVGLLLAAAYYFPFASSIQSRVRESESCQQMYMILIGTHPLAILCSKFIASFTMSAIVSLITTLFVRISFNAPVWALYSLLYMYSLSLTAFSMIFGAIIPTERAAAIISPFIMFLSIVPAIGSSNPTEISGLSSLLPPTVFAKAVNQLSRGVQTGYVMSAVGPFTPKRAMWTLFGLAILYMLIAALLEYFILPNSGLHRLFQSITKKLTSAVDRSMKRLRVRVVSRFESEEVVIENVDTHTSSRNPQNTEFCIGGVNNTAEAATRFPQNAAVDSAVADEHREENSPAGDFLSSRESPAVAGPAAPGNSNNAFPRVSPSWRSFVAVRNLEYDIPGLSRTLQIPQADFYFSQLNCLVGHVGAGKSALLQVLMGCSDRPGGSVQVNGRDIWTKGQGHRGIGVCLQRTVVWGNMSVLENIRFVQLLSGRFADDVDLEQEQNTLVTALQLDGVCTEQAGRLTPGLLRKLAVAMAFAGGARTIFLDEPTASTDLSTRAEIWRIISQNTRQRCIIVASTDIDQVGQFADHITVLHRGRVSMAGTPEYIRRQLCGGWVITVCRAYHTPAVDILDRVMAVAPPAVLVSNVSNELAFRIPEKATNTYVPKLLTELHRARQSNLITSIAVSDGHFSEAFVRLARTLDLREVEHSNTDDRDHNDVSSSNNDNNNVSSLHDEDSFNPSGSSTHYTKMPSEEVQSRSALLSGYQGGSNSSPSNLAVPRSIPSPSNTIGTVEDRERRVKHSLQIFSRSWRGIFFYRTLDATMSPFYAFLSLLLPLALIALSTAYIGKGVVFERFTESRLTEWEISSSPSTSYIAAFGGESSPYTKLIKDLNGKDISNTMSHFSQLDNSGENGMTSNSSVGLDGFFHAKGYPSNKFLFGAFALQGPIFSFPKTTAATGTHFPWVTDVVLHNTSYPPSLPVYVQLLGMMRIWTEQNNMQATISASVGVSDAQLHEQLPSTVKIMSTILLSLAFAFYGCRMVAELVEQRVSGLLQVLFSSSLHPEGFWLANFTYDIMSFTILSFAGVAVYTVSDVVYGFSGRDVMTLLGILVIFGCSIISLSYIISKCFNKPIAAQSFAIGLGVFTGFAFLIAFSAVRFLPYNPMTALSKKSNEGYAMIMRLFPLFTLGEVFMSYSLNEDAHGNDNMDVHLLPLIAPVILFVLLIIYESTMSINMHVFLRQKVWRRLDKVKARVAAQINAWSGRHEMEKALYRWEDQSLLFDNEDPSVVAERGKGYTANGLHVAEVWKKYPGDNYALQNVSVNVEGESLVVVGVNGSGKSTLLRCLSSDLMPSAGSVFVNGYCSSHSTRSRLAANRFLGYATASTVLQETSLTPYVFLNVMADLRMVRRGAMRRQHILFLLHTLGIEPVMHIGLSSLSVSVQRRVEIAAALVGYPPVLVLDDPTGSLDPLARRQVWAAVRSSPAETTAVLSTRSLDDAEMLGDRVLLLDEGKMKFLGTPAEWRQSHGSGFKVCIDVPQSTDYMGNSSYHAEKRDILRDFFAAHWEGSSMLDSQPFHYVFHIPSSRAENEEMGQSASSSTTGVASVNIRSILSTLLRGRSSGWEVENGTGLRQFFKCFIKVSEFTLEDAAMAAFTMSSQNLYDRNFYLPPRNY